MTNFEKIKNMSVEELAKTISYEMENCIRCPLFDLCTKDSYSDIDCSGMWEQWLKSEVEE